MPLSPDQHQKLERFASSSDIRKGAWFIDLDGVIFIQSGRGKFNVSKEAEQGIRDTLKAGCPVIVNSLRFPASIIESIASKWLLMFEKEIPAVLLNGGLIGRFVKSGDAVSFEETVAHPMTEQEIDGIVNGVADVLRSHLVEGPHRLALLFYPRDWSQGEIAWVPKGTDLDAARRELVNASEVVAWSLDELRQRLKEAGPCMAVTLVDKHRADQDKSPLDFFTTKDIDKASGSREMASMLGISLSDSAGAGDSAMDSFLRETGLAVRVGTDPIPFKGTKETIDVLGSVELGEAMSALARISA